MVRLHQIHRYQSLMLKNVKEKMIEPAEQQCLKNKEMKRNRRRHESHQRKKKEK